VVILLVIFIPVQNVGLNLYANTTNPVGFWNGLWHGITIPVVFIVSWFTDTNIALYEVRNNGFWYNLGFLLGINSWAALKFNLVKIRTTL
jgi:hypothetical protein